MKSIVSKSICLLTVLVLTTISFNAEAKENTKIDTTWNEWNFRISPYFWFMGFKGTIYRPPQVTQMPEPPPLKFDIDVGFKDIKNSIKFAIMLAGKYRNEHFVTQFNFSSLVLESEAFTPKELILVNNIINMAHAAGDISAGYRFIKNPKIELEGLIGLKFIFVKIGLSSKIIGQEIQGERSKIWFDPVLGMNFKYLPHRKIEFVTFLDIGTQLATMDLNYQFIGLLNYKFTKTFFISTGYRFYHVEIPKEEAIYNGSVKGWMIKLGFQF